MNKRQFLARLEKELSKLNNEERKRQLDYYEEMINDRIDEGMSEEEAVAGIGTVQGIAAKILSEVSPEQFKKKKKIGTVGWILIVLAALLLIGAVLAGVGFFAYSSYRFDDDSFEVEDIIEERLGLDDGWMLGGKNAEFNVNEVGSVDIVWACGDVDVYETEGHSIAVKTGDDDALGYQIKDGTLYIESTEAFDGKANLKILIPEDMVQLQKLSIVTTAGKVFVDSEYFAELKLVTASGDIRVEGDDMLSIDATSSSGDIKIFADGEDAFVFNYASCSGKVSVGCDRSFRNESGVDGKGNAIPASYDHSFGSANYISINAVTVSGDIKLIDD